MSKSLVVVESPTKVKTLAKYLGRDFVVKASVGHVWDLPKSKLGIDIGERFEPHYEVIKGKQKVLEEIRKAAKDVDTVYLASDPDREGEAIAWHLAQAIAGKKTKKAKAGVPKIHRILIDEITKQGIERAMASPGELNRARYESQQARRILDRLVGYKISPLLWEKVQRGLSAGRVQSVALRIVCERERKILAFVAVEYWTIEVLAGASVPPSFVLRLLSKNDQKLEIPAEKNAKAVEQELKKYEFCVTDVSTKERKRTPPPAFTTSKLQQEASRKLGFGPKKTMILAQQLYEGVELGDEGAVGLITYMRTDSTRLSNEAIGAARDYVRENFGKEYLPEKPRFYRAVKKAQDAHEAIRPTLLVHPPAKVKKFLKRDQYALYHLIWNRFLACQMEEAVYDQTTIDAKAGPYGLRASGSVLRYDGFMKLYVEGTDEAEAEDEAAQFPPLEVGEKLKVESVTPSQHFTKPPPRFTEASLVKELEENGIGRPSTYAAILSTLQGRKYVVRNQGGVLEATELGFLVNDLLVENFKDVMEVEFTAQMEEQLDEVEEGGGDWQEILKKFYEPFSKDLKLATQKMRDVKREETPTDVKCEKCGSPMVIKWGRHGHFLACSGYPECRNTKEFKKAANGEIEIVKQPVTDEVCDACGSPMSVKTGRFGKFLACSRYPECKTTRSLSTGVPCPEKDCDGRLLERRTKRGRVFYGCSNYPKCKHALWNRPVKSPCPGCQAPYLVEKFSKKDGPILQCAKENCGYFRPVEQGKA